MEHASVAAFARFTMDLLQLGAPPVLLRDAARAIEDEVRHATLCFSVAHRLSGVAQGPGALDTRYQRPPGDSATQTLTDAILEGCVEETVAAEIAREMTVRALPDFIREASKEIARDEDRHADLSWRFVAWLLEQRPDLRDVAIDRFRAALANDAKSVSPGQILPKEGPEDLGRLKRSTRAMVRRRALSEIIAPRAAQLLGAAAFA